MRRSRFFALAVLFGLAAASLTRAVAQSPAAPGAGHGFLIDKHLSAGLNCSSCHGESPTAKAPDMATCLKCHGTYPQIAATTANDNPNPHASHQGDLACSSCHHIHKASELYCSQCHAFDMKVP